MFSGSDIGGFLDLKRPIGTQVFNQVSQLVKFTRNCNLRRKLINLHYNFLEIQKNWEGVAVTLSQGAGCILSCLSLFKVHCLVFVLSMWLFTASMFEPALR